MSQMRRISKLVTVAPSPKIVLKSPRLFSTSVQEYFVAVTHGLFWYPVLSATYEECSQKLGALRADGRTNLLRKRKRADEH
jgi:hypothetical protein